MSASVTEPAVALPGVLEPLARPAFWRSRTGVGGVFRTKLNVRSSKIVISTGMIVPAWASVAALYCLTNSMIGTPWGPRAVPTGGAGVALPAGIWILTIAATRFFAIRASHSLARAYALPAPVRCRQAVEMSSIPTAVVGLPPQAASYRLWAGGTWGAAPHGIRAWRPG